MMRFAYLVYASRSGSTYLMRQLADFTTNVVALPESRLLEFLLLRGDQSIRRYSSNQLYSLLKSDPQASGLQFSENTWSDITEKCQGKGIRKLTEEIVSQYAKKLGKEPDIAIIKHGQLLNFHRELLELFPESCYIHIYRDGRAVASSMLKTPRPYFPGETMGQGDIILCANHWNEINAKVGVVKQAKMPIIEVSFEDLCIGPEAIMRTVTEQLGISFQPELFEKNSSFQVASKESEIHPLIHKKPIVKRLTAWQEELPLWQGVAFEFFAKKYLKEKGYEEYFLHRTTKTKKFLFLFFSYLYHLISNIGRIGRRLKNPRFLLHYLRNFFYRST